MKIYISSTFVDLKDYRQSVIAAIRRLRHECISMEDYSAESQLPVDKCLKDVASCDLYVGIFAWRYGYIPDNYNYSITELEYRKAKENNIPTLIFLLDEDVPWPPKYCDHGDDHNRIIALRNECAKLKLVNFFQSPSDLSTKIVTAIALHIPPTIKTEGPLVSFGASPKKAPRVSLAHLPITGAARYGREDESKRLRDVWDQGKVNVLTVVGWGGEGKSSLINSWLAGMAKDNYLGAEAVFGWCFYDAEMKNQEASADIFITSALQWLGDPDTTLGSPWEKGVRLAELVRSQRMLLILDGIETLQQPLGSNEGHIKDQSFQAFLMELAGQNPGLCVITTRLAVTDLQSYVGNTVEEMFLKPLDFESGADLLANMGVRGSHTELVKAAQEYGGHALSLTLLGSYLVEVCNGDISLRDEISSEREDKAEQVMTSYENWLGEGPEIQILRLLGVLSRTASPDAIDTLRAEPVINGVTNHLSALNNREWNRAVSRLRKLKLVAENNPQKTDILDTHPLVRQHFSMQLQKQNPEGWKEANNRLFEYYRNLPKQDLPDMLDEMIHLFHAVAHGCKAGRHQEAWDEVYWPRIRREEAGFSVLTLNVYGADLVALTSFFDRCWDRPVSTLNELAKARVFTETAFDLRGLGRLEEAILPQRSGLNSHYSEKRWWSAADAAGNLSELLITFGQLEQAITDAKISVDLARNSDNPYMYVTNLATLAEALYQSGQIIQAENYFREADAFYKKDYANTENLHSLLIFHFCDLLIEKGSYEEVIRRASASLQIEEVGGGQLHHRIGLSHLALASALMAECRVKEIQDLSSPYQHVRLALDNLRMAGHQELVVRGLLVSAELYQTMGKLLLAESELDEATATAARGQMKLHQVDALLQNVHLRIAMSQIPKAQESLSSAQQLIRYMGYHKKDKEAKLLELKLFKLSK